MQRNATKDLSNTFIAIDEMVTLTKAEMEVIESLVGSGATVEFHATLTTYGVHTAKYEAGGFIIHFKQTPLRKTLKMGE